MEEYLQRTKSRLSRSKQLVQVHAVLGSKACDLDSLISAVTYAYFLEKISPPDVLCLPVLNIPRTEFSFYSETRFILEELSIPESCLIFRDDINLQQLNDKGKLALTLVNRSELTSDDGILEPSVVKVINPDEQCDANLEIQESSSSLVVKEILQEAPELVTAQLAHLLRGSILFKCMTTEQERVTEQEEEILSALEEKFPELPPREDIINDLEETKFHAQGLSMEEAMLKDVRELSDGEIKVIVSTVYVSLEDFLSHRNAAGDLKMFLNKYGFDALVLLANYLSEEQLTKRQIVVYSENLELCNQICCELEECQNPYLELEPFEYGCDQILVYQQENSLVTYDQIVLLLKEAINRRRPDMVPNSRTSSTEAVAGSAPLSQGSSGIMELYGSDIEPQPSSVNFIDNPQDLNGGIQAHADVNVDLVSPDSGLATIRSSRSSKESSVFLSDDSPVAEGAGPHHSFIPGFDSYSPIPEGAIAEEQIPQSKKNSGNFDLFNFELAPISRIQSESSSHSADYSMADDFFVHSDSSEGQPPTVQKELDEEHPLGNGRTNYSNDLLVVTIDDVSVTEFDDEFTQRQEYPEEYSEKTSILTDFVDEDSPSSSAMQNNVEAKIPPTPMNSLVESSPLDNGPPLLFSQDVIEKINEIQSNADSSQSHCKHSSWWGGIELESQNSILQTAEVWSSSEHESVFQSPDSWMDKKASPPPEYNLNRRHPASTFHQKGIEQLEYSNTDHSDDHFTQIFSNDSSHTCAKETRHLELGGETTESSNTQNSFLQDVGQPKQDFDDFWTSTQPFTLTSDPWCPSSDGSVCLSSETFDAWNKFDQEENAKTSENVWGLPFRDSGKSSMKTPDESTVSKIALSLFTANNEAGERNTQMFLEAYDKEREHLIDDRNTLENTAQKDMRIQCSVKDPENESQLSSETASSWEMCRADTDGRFLEPPAPGEDSLLSYRCLDFSTSTLGKDLIVSPPDTNYSTSDSNISPTCIRDVREPEEATFDHDNSSSSSEDHNIWSTADKQYTDRPSYSKPENQGKWISPAEDASQSEVIISHTDTLLALTEQTDATYYVADYESSPSSSEDPGFACISNQKGNQSSPLYEESQTRMITTENKEPPNMAIHEETAETKGINTVSELTLITNDASANGKVSKDVNPLAEAVPLLSTLHLHGWEHQLQEDHRETWEHSTISGGSDEERDGLISEQLTVSDICNPITQDNSSSVIMLKQVCATNSEGEKFTYRTPDLLEEAHNSDNLKECERSGVDKEINESPEKKESISHQDVPDNQEIWNSTLQDDIESSTSSDEEEPSEPSNSLSCCERNTSQPAPQSTDPWDTGMEKVATPETESVSENTEEWDVSKGESKEEQYSPVMNEDRCGPQSDPNSPIKALAENLNNVQENLPNEICRNLDLWNSETESIITDSEMSDSYETPTVDKVLHSEHQVTLPYGNRIVHVRDEMIMDYEVPVEIGLQKGEACETSTGIQATEYAIMPHDGPDESVYDAAQSTRENPAISEALTDVNRSKSAYEEKMFMKTYHEENDLWSASTNDHTNPEIGISPQNEDAWEILENNMQDTSLSEDNKDVRCASKASDTQSNAAISSEKSDFENETQVEDDLYIIHKVPKNLDVWNTQIDDDTVSSLTSPDVSALSEISDASLGETQVRDNQKDTSNVPEPTCSDNSQSSATTPGTDEDSLNGSNALEVKLSTMHTDPKKIHSFNTANINGVSLATTAPETHEASAYLDSWDIIQEEIRGNITHEHHDYSDAWNSLLANQTSQTISAGQKEKCFSDNLEKWNIAVGTHSGKNAGRNLKFESETLGFSDDISDWWNTEVQEGKILEVEHSVSDSGFENAHLENYNTSTVPEQSECVLLGLQSNSFTKEILSPKCLSEDCNDPIEPLWNNDISKYEKQLKQTILPTTYYEEDLKEQVDGIAVKNEPVQLRHAKNQQHPDTLVTVTEAHLTHGQSTVHRSRALSENMELTHIHLNLENNTNSSKQEQKDLHENVQLPHSLIIFSKNDPSYELRTKSSPRCIESAQIEDEQLRLIPDILHDSTQDSNHMFAVDPDLWNLTEDSFDQHCNINAEGENADVLIESDSSSQVLSSSDMWHECDPLQVHSDYPVPEEGKPLSFIQLNAAEDADIDLNQKAEIPDIGSPQGIVQSNINESHHMQIVNEFNKLQESYYENVAAASGVGEAEESMILPSIKSKSLIPCPESLVMVPTNMIDTSYADNDDPALANSAFADMNNSEKHLDADTFYVSEENMARGVSAGAIQQEKFPIDKSSMPTSRIDRSSTTADHDTERGSNIAEFPGVLDATSSLFLADKCQMKAVKTDGTDKEICLTKELFSDNQCEHKEVSNFADNVDLEMENLLGSQNASSEVLANMQAPMAYKFPSDQSFITETMERDMVKDEMSLSLETIKVEVPSSRQSEITPPQTERDGTKKQLFGTFVRSTQEDPVLASLTLEGELNAESSDTSKEQEKVQTSNADSPAGGDISPSYETVRNLMDLKGDGRVQTKTDCEVINIEAKNIVKQHTKGQNMAYEINSDVEGEFEFVDANAVTEQTESHETFSTGSSDRFQPVSMRNEGKSQATRGLNQNYFQSAEQSLSADLQGEDDVERPQENLDQGQTWRMGVNQAEGLDSSPEECSSRTETVDSGSGQSVKELDVYLDPELMEDAQGGFEANLTRRERSPDGSAGDSFAVHALSNDSELEGYSSQFPEDDMAAEQDMQEEREICRALRSPPEDVGMDILHDEGMLNPDAAELRPEPPNSLDLDSSHPRRVKLTAPNISLSLDQSEGSVLSDDNLDTPDELDINVDDLDTPDEAESFEYPGHEDRQTSRDVFQEKRESIPEYTAEEEREDNRLWRTVVIGEQEQRIDMKVIEPYKKVISHGGYYGDRVNAIIVFAACFLPDSSRADYNYVMENLFLYVISTLELMVAEDYMIVYLNGATPRRRMPGLGWMKRCYQMIDRRLRKNLKSFIIVHPSWFIRTILAVTRPFISSKFSSKIKYVSSLAELRELIPMEYVHIPDSIIKYDEEKCFSRRMRLDEDLREASEAANWGTARCRPNEPEMSAMEPDFDKKAEENV